MANSPYPMGGSMGPPPPYTGQSQQADLPVQKIELKVSCRNLIDLDVFSKSDPFIVFYMLSQNKTDWREIDRTEVIMDNLNPDFVKAFIVDYFFEEQQMVKFEVYDWDSDSTNLKDHDYIGRVITSIGAIVGENGGKFEHALQVPKKLENYLEKVATAKDNERNDAYTKKSPGTLIDLTELKSPYKAMGSYYLEKLEQNK